MKRYCLTFSLTMVKSHSSSSFVGLRHLVNLLRLSHFSLLGRFYSRCPYENQLVSFMNELRPFH